LERGDELWEVCWQLLRIGYELPKGWLAGGMPAWRTAARELEQLPQWTVWELQRQIEQDANLFVLDVRQPQEWAAGHIPQATHITGAALPERADEVPRERRVAVMCGSGYRSSVAASLLQQRGYPHIVNVLGGMSAWQRAGRETVQERHHA
jgi:hydroxyacylglutathione hydrolase